MTADWPDDNPSAHRAAAIYSQKVPLARSSTILYRNANLIIGGGLQAQILSGVSVDQPSYEVTVDADMGAGVGTVPFYSVEFDWSIGTTVTLSNLRRFYGASGNGIGNDIITAGFGPCEGDFLSVVIANQDPTQNLALSVVVGATSHTYEHPQWRQDQYSPTAPIGFSSPGGEPMSGILATSNPTIVPGTPQKRLLATYRGKVWITLDNTGQANACLLQVGDPIGGLGAGYSPIDVSVAAGAVFTQELWLPARPQLVTLTNQGGAGNIAPKLVVITSDY